MNFSTFSTLKQHNFNNANYQTMSKILSGRYSVTLGNNVKIRQDDKHTIVASFYFADIIRYYESDNSIQISNGGNMSLSTKQALNVMLRGMCSIYQKDFTWYVVIGNDTYIFMGGMSIVDGLSDAIRLPEKKIKPIKPVLGVTLAMF